MNIRKPRVLRLIPIFLQLVVCAVTWPPFKIFAKIKFVGADQVLAIKGGVILVANHSSEFDTPLSRSGLPFLGRFAPIYYVSRPKDFYTKSGWRKIFYGGLLFNLLGSYPAYSGHKDYAYSLQNFGQILENGLSVAIFPEGKITEDGKIGFAHGGAAFLSHTYKKPVVPVAISGLYNLNLRDFLLFRRRVTITYGEPIPYDVVVPQQHPTVGDFQAGSRYVMTKISEMLSSQQ